MRGTKADISGSRGLARRLRAPAMVVAAVALGMVVAPTVSSAFASRFHDSAPVSLAARGGVGSFTPSTVDPRLAAQFAARMPGGTHLFRFTPAGTETRPNRAVTVAVRLADFSVRVMGAHGARQNNMMAPGAAPERIAPMVYNLGLSRGYQSFAGSAGLPRDIQRLDVPDLRSFGKSAGLVGTQSTPTDSFPLAPRIELGERERLGRAPRTLESQGEYRLDLGGSYRLTRNLDVTAGVRYSTDRDRLRPLTDRKQDSQAVYVGTQFRF
jgi:hypothetical protein